MFNEQPDILCITETWLNDNVCDEELQQPNYVLFRRDRNIDDYPIGMYTQTARGGVLIFTHVNMNGSMATIDSNGTESLWINISTTTDNQLLIGNCYRPELAGPPYVTKLCNLISSINHTNTVLVGDFNFRGIDWSTESALGNCEDMFLRCIQENFLHQMVTLPTRDKYINDLLLTTDESLVHNVEVYNHFGNSDHKVIEAEIQLHRPTMATTPRKVFMYSRGNYISMQQEANDLDWCDILGHRTSMEAKWEAFRSSYNRLTDKHIPSKIMKPGTVAKAPWLSNHKLKKSRTLKRSTKIQYRISKLHAHQIAMVAADKAHTSQMLTAKFNYEEIIARDCYTNPKRFYNYAKTSTKPKSSIDCLMVDNVKITNDMMKAKILNKHFATVMTKEPVNLPLYCTIATPNTLMSRLIVTEDEIIRHMLKLNPHKSIGPDNIHPQVLHEVPALAKPLLILFEQSLRTGVLPQSWTEANICAIFKKGKRTDPNNYRPISLTSHVAKLLERIIMSRLTSFCKTHNIISQSQHGFQSGSSCLTNLLECLNDWTVPRTSTDVIYTDFSKAFDSVPHRRLIHKLKLYGIRGELLIWLSAFLTERHQRVVVNGSASPPTKVISGVPQGTILGPILFLLYINDMPDYIHSCKLKLFADDAKLYKTITCINDNIHLQTELDALGAWTSDWLLKFNPAKCSVLRINPKHDHTYFVNGISIVNTSHQKDLGITITSDLKPSTHIANICKSANQRIGMIRRCFTNHSSNVVVPLYRSIVRPLLETCSPAWNPWLEKDKNALNSVQKRCIKLCTGQMTVDPLQYRRTKADLCEVYKIMKGDYKLRVEDYFEIAPSITRGHDMKIRKQHGGTDTRMNYFSNRIINAWNKLSPGTVSAPTIQIFKDRLEMDTFQ